MKQIAIIGPTASGKSDLAITMALEHNAYILSIDSLSIYTEVDIASAKPSHDDLSKVKHFGINTITVDTHFSVALFIDLYKQVVQEAKDHHKNLIIVGGTSFYLKSLTSGLSNVPKYTNNTKKKVALMLQDLPSAYRYLTEIDTAYMQNISSTDSYRIEKLLLLCVESQMSPTDWFKANPPQASINGLDIFNIDVARPLLRQRIDKRTKIMLETGLIDEVAHLEQQYGRNHTAMKAIGVVEVLDYLDGFMDKQQMKEAISTHTAQLAKRQQTFNRTQFTEATSATLEALPALIKTKF